MPTCVLMGEKTRFLTRNIRRTSGTRAPAVLEKPMRLRSTDFWFLKFSVFYLSHFWFLKFSLYQVLIFLICFLHFDFFGVRKLCFSLFCFACHELLAVFPDRSENLDLGMWRPESLKDLKRSEFVKFVKLEASRLCEFSDRFVFMWLCRAGIPCLYGSRIWSSHPEMQQE